MHSMLRSIALIAHDARKDDMVRFAVRHRHVLTSFHVIATGTTGERVRLVTGLTIEKKLSGPLGGDAQIAAEVVRGHVSAVIFFVDPLKPQPHEPDVQALIRLCNVHDVPLATNPATAEALIKSFQQSSTRSSPVNQPVARLV